MLMHTFGVSGKDLARIVHVDEALVSKWRHGKRTLKSNSSSADCIATHFISIDRDSKFTKLTKLLSADYSDIFSASEDEMAVYLKQWIAGDSDTGDMNNLFRALQSNPDTDIAISYHYTGNEGRRKAVDFFNEYARLQTTPIEIVAFTTEDGQWFYEDEQFRTKWKESYFSIINRGHIIKVIHPVNRGYEDMAESILSWAPIHLSGKTIDYYIPDYSDEHIFHTYFIIPGHLALYSSSSGNYTKSPDTWMTNDKYMLKNIENIIKEYLNKSQPLFTRYYIDSGEQHLSELISILQRRNMRYFHGILPSYMPLTEALLREIYEKNGFSEDESAKYKTIYERLSSLNLKGRIRYLISMESLSDLLASDEIEIKMLTYITGRRIIVDRATFLRVARESFDIALESGCAEVGLIMPDMPDALQGISVLALENTCVHFTEMISNKTFAMVLHEMTFIVAVMERIKKIWAGIPSRMKEKEYVAGRISDALADPS